MDLISRVKNILATPKTEWVVIAAESTDPKSLYLGYILPLAAITPICSFIGLSFLLGRLGVPVGLGLQSAIVSYILALVGVFVVGLIISKLAPSFGSAENLTSGLKVAAYSATAAWVGGVFMLLPFLGVITLLFAIYSLYLFWLGLPVVMGTPPANTLPYTVTIIVVAIVVQVLIGLLTRAVI